MDERNNGDGIGVIPNKSFYLTRYIFVATSIEIDISKPQPVSFCNGQKLERGGIARASWDKRGATIKMLLGLRVH